MANQFYYQIIDNTLYYGANQWEGASLTTLTSHNFSLTSLGTFTSILPHDDSIVVVDDCDENTILFTLAYTTYEIADFRNFTVLNKHKSFNSSSNNYITFNELYFWDGFENLTEFPNISIILKKFGSVKYSNGYIPDLYSLTTTFTINYKGIDKLSIGYVYTAPKSLSNTSGRKYNTSGWLVCPNSSIEFRRPIYWATDIYSNLGRIQCKAGETDFSNLYTFPNSYIAIGSGTGSSSGDLIDVGKSIVNTLKLYNLEGVVGVNNYLSDRGSAFRDNFQNIELCGLVNCGSIQNLFDGMTHLETVKLSGINNLTDINYTFRNCSSLTTIYTTELWNENLVGTNTFNNCSSLIGGNGTAYNSSKTDASMCHVDREGQEGYFTYNKATDYYKVYVPSVMGSVIVNYPQTLFSKGDNVSITFTGYSKDTTLDYWLQYDPTTKRYKNIGSQNPLNFEILADTALIPIVKKGTPSAVYNVDLTAVPSNSCTLAGAGAYTAGDNVIITANPNEGYVFKQWEELINETWIILSYDKEYTIEAIGRDRTIRAVCVEDTSDEVVEITLSLKGGSGSLEGAGKYVKGTKATIKVNVGSRSVFKSWNLPDDPFVVSTQNPYTFTVVKTIEYQAILADNPYGGGGTTEEGGGNGEFNDYIDFTPIPPLNLSATNTDLLSIYTLDQNGVNELAKFIYSDIFDATYQEKLNSILKLFGDVMDQIVSFGIVPFAVAGKASDIMPYLDIHAPVHCKIPYSQYITINCGTKTIGNYWNNFLDYSPYTKYELYLPFIGYKEIDADEIVNKNLSIKYRVDILTGDLVCFITIDEKVRYQFGGNCLISLPLNSSAKDTGSVISGVASLTTAVGGLLLGSGTAAGAGIAGAAVNLITDKQTIKHGSSLSSSSNYLGVLNPVLYITRPRQNVPADYGKIKGYPSNITTQLKNLSGYTVIDEIHLENMSATDDEIEEIETLLKQGVIIN